MVRNADGTTTRPKRGSILSAQLVIDQFNALGPQGRLDFMAMLAYETTGEELLRLQNTVQFILRGGVCLS